MKLQELINRLHALESTQGDLEVLVADADGAYPIRDVTKDMGPSPNDALGFREKAILIWMVD